MNTPEHIKEKFLPLKQSKILSKMGFDEECLAYHENQDGTLVVFYSNLPLSEEQEKRPGLYKSEIRNSSLPQWATAAPTISDALDWFFDRFRLYGEIFMDDDLTFGFLISRPAFVYNFDGRLDYNTKRSFSTRYEARIACLDEMVCIVKERRHLDEGPKPVTELMRKMSLLNSGRPADTFDQNDELHKRISEEAKTNRTKK